ncbi:MAG: biliverdin-producing heme oxygenase [Planctomycetota bacterium]
MTTADDTRPLTQRLKEDNWDLHQLAEKDALPAHMVAGTLQKDDYVRMLGQMYCANRVLDQRIRERRSDVAMLRDLIADRQFQEPYLETDLKYWGADPATVEPLPETQALIDLIDDYANNDPLKLFGLHYVREGANNGNKFVAMKIKKSWGHDSGDGFAYLDPYGDGQRPLWERFKRNIDKAELTEDQKAGIVASARKMFEHIRAINNAFDLEPVAEKTPTMPTP